MVFVKDAILVSQDQFGDGRAVWSSGESNVIEVERVELSSHFDAGDLFGKTAIGVPTSPQANHPADVERHIAQGLLAPRHIAKRVSLDLIKIGGRRRIVIGEDNGDGPRIVRDRSGRNDLS